MPYVGFRCETNERQKDKAGANEINSVVVSCTPYGESINQPVTLTDDITSHVMSLSQQIIEARIIWVAEKEKARHHQSSVENWLTSVLPKARRLNTKSDLEDHNVPTGHPAHPLT
ncbi:hypothetical protein TNCV_253821 [Trichonephila clavipes]|nr:hypothetical protein TNCV_253821 [Trichonephila clavipes]